MENLSEILGGRLSTKEVAERLGLTVAKVHYLRLTGALVPDVKFGGKTGSYFYSPDAVDAYLNEREAS